MRLATVRGHTFIADRLDANSVVVDLGAHKGEFSMELNRRHGCRCHIVEAAPELFAGLPEGGALRKYHLAMSGREGPVKLFVSENPEANSLRPVAEAGAVLEVPGLGLAGFLARAGIDRIDLLKMDIEGAEIEVLEAADDELLARVAQLTVEFHDFVPGLADPRRVEGVRRRLRCLGFRDIRFSRALNTDVLFVNARDFDLGWAGLLYLKYLAKYARGLARVLRRRLHGRTATRS